MHHYTLQTATKVLIARAIQKERIHQLINCHDHHKLSLP